MTVWHDTGVGAELLSIPLHYSIDSLREEKKAMSLKSQSAGWLSSSLTLITVYVLCTSVYISSFHNYCHNTFMPELLFQKTIMKKVWFIIIFDVFFSGKPWCEMKMIILTSGVSLFMFVPWPIFIMWLMLSRF